MFNFLLLLSTFFISYNVNGNPGFTQLIESLPQDALYVLDLEPIYGANALNEINKEFQENGNYTEEYVQLLEERGNAICASFDHALQIETISKNSSQYQTIKTAKQNSIQRYADAILLTRKSLNPFIIPLINQLTAHNIPTIATATWDHLFSHKLIQILLEKDGISLSKAKELFPEKVKSKSMNDDVSVYKQGIMISDLDNTDSLALLLQKNNPHNYIANHVIEINELLK